jgi:hypothetical protein
MKTIDLIHLPSMICAECGYQLRPMLDELRGILCVDPVTNTFTYKHAGYTACSHSEEVCQVPAGEVITCEVVGRMDWRTSPPKLVRS